MDRAPIAPEQGCGLVPGGGARCGNMLLADMRSVFRLVVTTVDWSQGAWVAAPDFNNLPGACLDDHASA